ncbi:MAG TPA: hypothetical protein VF832_05700 [Longimicrobiales bacterium]
MRQIDLRVFAEVLAAIILSREPLILDQANRSTALAERTVQRRRRAARHILQRLQEQPARGSARGDRQATPISATPGSLRKLAGVLAVAWGGWEGFIAAELSALLVLHRRAVSTAAFPGGGRSVAA